MIKNNDLFSFMSLYNAYIACRKRKRGAINALNFEADTLENLFSLEESLKNGSYHPGRSVCFVTIVIGERGCHPSGLKKRVITEMLIFTGAEETAPLFKL